jgi:hypothetical protein
MASEQRIAQVLAVVLIGDFNPKIFQPAWFAAEGLIQRQEAEAAQIEVIHPDLVVFELEWCKLQVSRDRFQLTTTHELYHETMRDLLIGTFELLRHTPVRMMGINRHMHFNIGSEENWNNLGHRLAPKAPWKDILINPGMRTLIMEESKRRDNLKGYIRVHVAPAQVSVIVFKVNDHYEVSDPNSLGSSEIINILKSSWDESLKRSEKIIHSLLEQQ